MKKIGENKAAPIKAVVNAAGVSVRQLASKSDSEADTAMQECFQVNVLGTIQFTHQVLRRVILRDLVAAPSNTFTTSIVHIGSIASVDPTSGQTIYAGN